MGCEICGRGNCTRSFHSIEAQQEYDEQIGDKLDDAKDKLLDRLERETFRLDSIEVDGETYIKYDDVINMINDER